MVILVLEAYVYITLDIFPGVRFSDDFTVVHCGCARHIGHRIPITRLCIVAIL